MKKQLLFIIALMFVATISKAQIPNAGFETWTSMGSYNNPDSWSCLNDITTSMSTYTCMKGTPGNPGTSYLKLVSKTVTGLGVVPGIAVCGSINTTTMQADGGFPFTSRPANLTGSWQHMIFGSSQGYIDVTLTKWNSSTQMRDVIASAHNVLSGMAMSWANFTIPLTYMSGSNPDSCVIVCASSGSTPTVNDYLYVDALSFTGSVTGISENNFGANINVYPNPASELLFIGLSRLKGNSVSIQVFDAQGKNVRSEQSVNISSKTSLDISALPKGNYVLNIITSEGIVTRNFIKQ